MIHRSEDGITIRAPLAWTMAVALITGGVWVGGNISEVHEGIDMLRSRQTEDREAIQRNAEAIGRLSASDARIEQRLSGVDRRLGELQAGQREILRYLRERGPDETSGGK